MICISIVEDEKNDVNSLIECLNRFETEFCVKFKIDIYENAGSFVESYKTTDIIFMDIVMPGISGMDAAKMIREVDANVILIFVTSMKQYAIEGYSVDAFDFVVKPFDYNNFSFRLKKAVSEVEKSRNDLLEIVLAKGVERIRIKELLYVEIDRHDATFHMYDDDLTVRLSMKRIEAMLRPWNFLRCNNCYLINPGFIDWVRGYDVKVGDEILKISHPRKKQFLEELSRYYS